MQVYTYKIASRDKIHKLFENIPIQTSNDEKQRHIHGYINIGIEKWLMVKFHYLKCKPMVYSGNEYSNLSQNQHTMHFVRCKFEVQIDANILNRFQFSIYL